MDQTIQWTTNFFDVCESTQDIAHQMADDGAPAGTVIIAHRQTDGRGRRGNNWISLPGNLLCSFILRPNKGSPRLGEYSFITAVALADTIETYLRQPAALALKWPNDILIDRKKVAGILLEARDSALIIGVGVNLVHAPAERTSVLAHAHHDVSLEVFLKNFLGILGKSLAGYTAMGFKPVRERWLSRAIGLNEPIQVRLPNETVGGVFMGLDSTGALLLRLESGATRVINSGEVFFGQG